MTIKLLSKSKKSFNNSFIEVKEIINKTLLKILTLINFHYSSFSKNSLVVTKLLQGRIKNLFYSIFVCILK